MMSQKVLMLPGDGIGPSVIESAEQVLAAVAPSVEIVHGMVGRSAYESTGLYLPHETRDLLDECNVVLSGPSLQPETGSNPLTTLKVQLDLFARTRHFRTLAPDLGPEGVDVVLWGSNNNVASEITEVQDLDGIDLRKYIKNNAYSRMIKLALSDVEARELKKITCLIRSDFYPISSEKFKETFESMFSEKDYETRVMNVKDWAARISKDPGHDQCIICIDLYSHVVAGFLGGLTGYDHLNPTCYMGDEYKMYQPRHKALVGGLREGYVNPTSFILSAADILRDFNMTKESDAVVEAVRQTYLANERTPDVGGSLTTTGFTARILDRLNIQN